MQYQYKVFRYTSYRTTAEGEQDILNDLGEEGWRLVSVKSEGTVNRYYMIRENP